MQVIFGILYALLFLSYVATGLFIVYHLLRYSFDRKLGIFGALFFSGVFAVLLFTNAFLFFTLPWDRFFPAPSLPFGL